MKIVPQGIITGITRDHTETHSLSTPASQDEGQPIAADCVTKQGSTQASPDLKQASKLLRDDAAATFENAWSRDLGLGIVAMVRNTEGAVIAGVNAAVIAIDGATGSEKWTFKGHGGFFHPTAVGPDGTVYASTNQGDMPLDRLYAIDGSKGKEKWHIDAKKEAFFEKPAMSPEGDLFAASSGYRGNEDHRMLALDKTDGKILWQFRTGKRVMSEPLMGPGNTLVFGSDDKNVYSLDRTTGKKRWAFDAGAACKYSPVEGPDGTILILNNNGMLFSVDAGSGEEKWHRQAGVPHDFISAPPTVGPDGTVYCANTFVGPSAFDGKTGNPRWTNNDEVWVDAPLVADLEGNLYLANKSENGPSIIIFDGATGKKKEAIRSLGQVDHLELDEATGTLFCSNLEGKITAIRRLSFDDHMERITSPQQEPQKPTVEQVDDFIIIDSLKLATQKEQG
jgi:outer membrane protein assembly factor BamB